MKRYQKYLLAFALIVVLQLGGFYALERYLTPNAVNFATPATAVAAGPATVAAPVQDALTPPPNVVLFDIEPKGKRIAIYDKFSQVVVRDHKGTLSVAHLPGVHFLQWMDAGKTLFYMRNIYGKNEMGVFQVAENKVVPLHDIFERDIEVDQMFKSSYSQSINFIYKQGSEYRVGFYEAIFGFRSVSLQGKPANASFDEKEDVLTLETSKGKTLQYRHGTFLGEEKRPSQDNIKRLTSTQRGEALQ